jgi:hypothetical protein
MLGSAFQQALKEELTRAGASLPMVSFCVRCGLISHDALEELGMLSQNKNHKV